MSRSRRALTTSPSQRVILANRGVLLEEFTAPAALGGHRHLRYRVQLDEQTRR